MASAQPRAESGAGEACPRCEASRKAAQTSRASLPCPRETQLRRARSSVGSANGSPLRRSLTTPSTYFAFSWRNAGSTVLAVLATLASTVAAPSASRALESCRLCASELCASEWFGCGTVRSARCATATAVAQLKPWAAPKATEAAVRQ